MLRNIDSRAAILPAHGKSLHHTREDQQNRGRHADWVDPGKQANRRRRHSHQQDGLQEGSLATIPVPHVAEEHRPEGSYEEAGRERTQREDETGGFAARR